MRRITALVLSCCAAATVASAQEQESKLMERLLKPDMSLQNDAQKKQFAVNGSAPTKQASTKTFQFSQRTRTKTYRGVRNYNTQEFQTRTSRYQDDRSPLGERAARGADGVYATSGYADTRAAHDAGKTARSSQFNDSSRSFLVRGKSQKSLSAQDRPLTLEQVRELLNKNK